MLLAAARPASAEADRIESAPAAAAANADAPPRVFLWTVGPSDRPAEVFGHVALVFHDSREAQGMAWNWGIFDHHGPGFIPRLIRGSMLFSMGPQAPEALLAGQVERRRSVISNEILLAPSQVEQLRALVQENYRPENRDYLYCYFRDNCTTRIRDLLDTVLDGSLRRELSDMVAPHSYRWHVRRFAQEVPWLDLVLHVLLGSRVDRPISAWELTYLPSAFQDYLEAFRLPGAAGSHDRPLLGPRRVLHASDRTPVPAAPPPLRPAWPLLGACLGGGVVALGGRRVVGSRLAGLAVGLVALAWAVLAGALGTLLAVAWLTDHVFAQANWNLAYMSPLTLLLGLALPALVAAQPVRRRWLTAAGRMAVVAAGAMAASSVVVALLQLVGVASQANGEVVAVALPVNLGLALALRARLRRRPA